MAFPWPTLSPPGDALDVKGATTHTGGALNQPLMRWGVNTPAPSPHQATAVLLASPQAFAPGPGLLPFPSAPGRGFSWEAFT